MWGKLLSYIQSYLPKDLIEISVFVLCIAFMCASFAIIVDCHWYIHHFPATPVTGRCGDGARKDFLEALTTLVTLLIAFMSGKRTGENESKQNDNYKYKDDED